MKGQLKHFTKKCYDLYIAGIPPSVFYMTAVFIAATLLFQNRALFIGYIFGLFLTLCIRSRSVKKTRNLILLSIGLILSTVIIASLLKTDSTDGRILIYKLSSKILSESFPVGVGLNNFDVAYGNSQIDYFKSGHYSQNELLLADNIVHVYNDYLELMIELGWVGVILILFFLITVAFLIKNALELNPHGPILLFLACVQMIAIAIAALFTFMIYQIHWQGILLVSLLILIYFNGYLRLKQVLIVGIILLASLITYHFGHHVIFKNDYDKAKEAFALSRAGYSEDANKIYKEIYRNLENDNSITTAYIHSLTENGEFEEAEKLLGNLLLKDNSTINYNLLGSCYEKQHKTEQAEAAYRNSIYKVPNRFTGRFHLFSLYLTTNQSEKAISTGMEILRIPVKVPSKIVEYFRSTVKEELHKAGALH